jgi:hypothetical protein
MHTDLPGLKAMAIAHITTISGDWFIPPLAGFANRNPPMEIGGNN